MDFHCKLIQNYSKTKLQNKSIVKRQQQQQKSKNIHSGFYIEKYGF